MEKLPLIIIVCIIVAGIAFWVFNNPNGIGKGIDNGGINLKHTIEDATSRD
ncbi:hypothetical protein [Paenibacillus sp. MMO-58]|uniref:hypothetical protein n=1 Tax=Paenibacillus sp. MMO-58 TaxID=3081290 RepID=UPI003017389B